MTEPDATRGRVRSWIDGGGRYFGPAVLLLIFAVLVILIELQSSDVLLWTGHHVTGTERGGIVSYRWHGETYTLDAPGYGSAKRVSVYLDPSDPTGAMLDNVVNRLVMASLAGLPVLAALALTALGLTRRARAERRNRRHAMGTGYGQGLDPDLVAGYLKKIRGGPGES